MSTATEAHQDSNRVLRKPRRQPAFIAKTLVQTRNGTFWRTIGAAWTFKDGSAGLSIALHSQPFNWDGRFTLFESEPEEQVPDHDTETGEVLEMPPASTRSRRGKEPAATE